MMLEWQGGHRALGSSFLLLLYSNQSLHIFKTAAAARQEKNLPRGQQDNNSRHMSAESCLRKPASQELLNQGD